MSDIIIIDQKILRQISRPTTWEEIKELDLKKRLRKALKTAWIKGAGVAAIQIGVPVRFVWIHTPNDKEEFLINPEIIERKGEGIYFREACLSIPHNYVNTKRWFYIEYISGGKKRTANNFKAVLIQHEIDHLDGILNIDRQAK